MAFEQFMLSVELGFCSFCKRFDGVPPESRHADLMSNRIHFPQVHGGISVANSVANSEWHGDISVPGDPKKVGITSP